ncbi:hypothetical protein GGX14DRAFT_576136 [Mycena pura]|uniref:Uncharacterized protein n=1 Tax=Mycena pura TaxID=153505 RepID=A0AAD6UXN9_9AGAR|nr:hypothetical protein GGX14DRAFT_576136 [Mycena pura]
MKTIVIPPLAPSRNPPPPLPTLTIHTNLNSPVDNPLAIHANLDHPPHPPVVSGGPIRTRHLQPSKDVRVHPYSIPVGLRDFGDSDLSEPDEDDEDGNDNRTSPEATQAPDPGVHVDGRLLAIGIAKTQPTQPSLVARPQGATRIHKDDLKGYLANYSAVEKDLMQFHADFLEKGTAWTKQGALRRKTVKEKALEKHPRLTRFANNWLFESMMVNICRYSADAERTKGRKSVRIQDLGTTSSAGRRSSRTKSHSPSTGVAKS